MKVALFSDLHLDSPFRWAGPDKGRQIRNRLRDTLGTIIDKCLEEDVDAVLCGGDLFEHDFVTPDTEKFLRDSFARLEQIPVFLAPGNHDYLSKHSLYARTQWSANVHLFEESRLQPHELEDGLTLWGAAHLVPANTDGFLDNFSVGRGGVHVALFHGSERGWFTTLDEEGKQAHAPFDADQVAESGLAHAFLGHYHSPKTEPFLTYPGNPHPLTFGETGARGLVIATIGGDGSVERETINVAATEFHEIDCDVTGCSNREAIKDRLANAIGDKRGVARITLSGELEPDVDLQTSDLASVAAVLEAYTLRSDQVSTAFDVEAIGQEQTVRGEFVREVLESVDPLDRDNVLTIGLRALGGRDDLDVV